MKPKRKTIEPAYNHSTFQPESGLWVALRNAPSDYSHDKALLIWIVNTSELLPQTTCLSRVKTAMQVFYLLS